MFLASELSLLRTNSPKIRSPLKVEERKKLSHNFAVRELQLNRVSFACELFANERTNLPLEGIDDELEVKRVDALDALLDDVVAVLVLDALEHVSFQFGDDELRRKKNC